MQQDSKSRWGVVSGGTSGIGLATAKLLLAQGDRVLLVGSTEEKCLAAAKELGRYDARVVVLQADLSTVEGCTQVGQWVAERKEAVDFLVNCAGAYLEQPLSSCTENDYNYIMDVNLKSTIFLTKALLTSFGPEAAIVNVASDAGIGGNYGCALYSAAKGGVVAFTRSLALDLAPKVRVNCVCPGDVDTPLVAAQLVNCGYTKEEMGEVYPLGRIACPEEVAYVIVSLLSPLNTFMTGAIVPVDGGLTAKG